MEYLSTPITVAVHTKHDNPIFSDRVVHVSIDDEAGGGFIILKQNVSEVREQNAIALDLEELEFITEVAKNLLKTYDNNTVSSE